MMRYFKKWDMSLLDKAIPLDSMLYRYRRHMSHYKKIDERDITNDQEHCFGTVKVDTVLLVCNNT